MRRTIAAAAAQVLLELSRREWEALNRADGVLRLLMLGDTGASAAEIRAELDRLIREHEQRAA